MLRISISKQSKIKSSNSHISVWFFCVTHNFMSFRFAIKNRNQSDTNYWFVSIRFIIFGTAFIFLGLLKTCLFHILAIYLIFIIFTTHWKLDGMFNNFFFFVLLLLHFFIILLSTGSFIRFSWWKSTLSCFYFL